MTSPVSMEPFTNLGYRQQRNHQRRYGGGAHGKPAVNLETAWSAAVGNTVDKASRLSAVGKAYKRVCSQGQGASGGRERVKHYGGLLAV